MAQLRPLTHSPCRSCPAVVRAASASQGPFGLVKRTDTALQEARPDDLVICIVPCASHSVVLLLSFAEMVGLRLLPQGLRGRPRLRKNRSRRRCILGTGPDVCSATWHSVILSTKCAKVDQQPARAPCAVVGTLVTLRPASFVCEAHDVRRGYRRCSMAQRS